MVVSDTSCLIGLERIERLDLLPRLFSAELTLEHQITAHQPGDLTADGQAEAGPITRPE